MRDVVSESERPERSEERRCEERLFLISACAVLSFLVFISVLAAIGGGLRPTTSVLRIASVDISAHAKSVNEVVLNVSVCVDNSGDAPSGEVEIEVKVYNAKTNLLVARNSTSVGRIAPEKSEYASCLISLPREGDYRIEVVVFEDGRGILRAEREVYGVESVEPPGTARISLREIDFQVESVESVGDKEYARINTTLFIDNLGADVSGLNALVKARDNDTRHIVDKKWIDLGTLECGKTALRHATLTVLNRRDYVVEVQVFQQGRIIREGKGMVLLSPFANKTIFIGAEEKRVEISPSLKISDFIPQSEGGIPRPTIPPMERAPTPSAPTPGFGAAEVAFASVLALMQIYRRRSRKRERSEDKR